MRWSLLTLVCFLPAVPAFAGKEAPPPKTAVVAAQPDWDRLVAIGKKYGMAMPPESAKLALIATGGSITIGDRSDPRDPTVYSPGWLLEDHGDEGIVALRGLYRAVWEPRGRIRPFWRAYSTEDPAPKQGGHVTQFNVSSCFAVAIQCAARGDRSHAEELWKCYSSHTLHRDDFDTSWYPDEYVSDPSLLFAAILFHFEERAATNPEADLPTVEAHMRGLLTDFPALANAPRKDLLALMAATNAIPAAPAGSVEALLVEYGKTRRDEYFKSRGDWDDPDTKIIRMGFDAIPELIRLSKDPRLTSQYWPILNLNRSSSKTVGDLAVEILCELLPGSYHDDQGSQRAAAHADFEAAWEAARQEKELAYDLRMAFQKDEEGRWREERGPMVVLTAKYPESLPELVKDYERLPPDALAPEVLCRAIHRSTLTDAQKRELLLELARGGGIGRRIAAILEMVSFDPATAREPARLLLRLLPAEVEETYWASSSARAGRVFLEIDDDEVWQEFFDKAKTTPIGVRLEWMNFFNSPYLKDHLQSRRLAFLAGFLEDESSRDRSSDSTGYEGLCAAFWFPTISVRDFAAMTIASILELDRQNVPDKLWSGVQWSELRMKVRAALESRSIAPMKSRKE